MSRKKIFYRYNPQTLSYDIVHPNTKSRIFTILRHLLSGILIGGGGLFFLIYFIGSPREKVQDKEIVILRTENEILSKRIDQAFLILEPIQERDDNMYRAIYHAEPIAPSIRTSGVGSLARYDQLLSIPNSDLIVETAQKMDILEKQLYIQTNSLNEILTMVKNQKDRIFHTPSIQPVANKDLTRVASGYGMRIDPVYGTPRFHKGMDFTSPTGTPVYATADGVVMSAKDHGGGFGKCIDISHGYNYMTKYAHLSKIEVTVGQKVKRGDTIGRVGNTGKSTGPHLHYEVHIRGQAQNPALFYHGDLSPEEFDLMLEQSANRGQVMD